jgi:predicted glycosyltransferase
MLYSHDSVGLGHLRRTLTLAASLAEAFPGVSMLLASGSEASLHFKLPEGLEVVKLPAVGKGGQGQYTSRRLPGGLPSLVRIRRGLLLQLVECYRPDLLIVDNKVLGVADELEPALERLRDIGGKAILGIRDIIDSPEVVADEWGRPKIRKALAQSYDKICVYGAPELYDMRREYHVPEELARIVRYVGYVVRPRTGPRYLPIPRLRPQVLATVGGGEDGASRIERYLDALELAPPTWDSVLVLGPLLDSVYTRLLKRRARSLASVTVHTFYEDLPRLFDASDSVVAMAGYNTVAEILRGRLPCVLLPRTHPRTEQLIRARRVERAGLAEVQLEPTASELRGAVERSLERGRFTNWLPPLDGARRFCGVVAELLNQPLKKEESVLKCDLPTS